MVLRVAALALLLLLVLVAVITTRMLRGLPDTQVYFVVSEERSLRLEPALRRVRADDPETQARAALAELIGGPTEAEAAQGLSSSVPADTTVLGTRLEDGVLTVDLSGDFESGGGTAEMQARLYQLFYTLTEPTGVEGVSLLIEDEPVRVFGGEGLLVPEVWRRPDRDSLPRW